MELLEQYIKKETVCLILFIFSGCTSEAAEPLPDGDGQPPYTDLITKTESYPSAYSQPSSHAGEVRTITYPTFDYVDGTLAPRTNQACVYIPYGYNTEREYNVLYLVHGHYGTYSSFLSYENGLLVNVLDNMIEKGDIEPVIVVTPSYNYGQPTSNYVDADKYCEALTQELLNDLMPIVESDFRTYAESADSKGFEQSRNHRMIGGFSMGAVTTWYAFEHLLPYFRNYLPISGDCWSLGTFAGMNRPHETAQYLADIVRQSKYGTNGFYIWAASGTSDSAYRETLVQIEAMAELSDVFNRRTMSFHEKDNARHEYEPSIEYVYNALKYFYPADSSLSGLTESSAHYKVQNTDDFSITGVRLSGDEKGIHIRNGKKIIIQ